MANATVYEAWLKEDWYPCVANGFKGTRYFKGGDINGMIKFFHDVIAKDVTRDHFSCVKKELVHEDHTVSGSLTFTDTGDSDIKYVVIYQTAPVTPGTSYITATGDVVTISGKDGKQEEKSNDEKECKPIKRSRVGVEYLSFRSRFDFFASNLLVNIADQSYVKENEVYYMYFDNGNNWSGMVRKNLYSDCPFTGDTDGIYFKDFQSMVNTITRVISRSYMLNPDTIGFSMGSFPDQPYQIIRFYCSETPGVDWTAKVFQGTLIKDKIYPMIDSKGRLLCYKAKGE